jgi:outer membrane lipoprotein-sorting protein
MTMVAEDPDEGIDRRKARMFRRDRDGAFVLLILEPQVNRGQGYLQVDDALWFYDPTSRAFSFTSMSENFQGSDARMSDFGTSTIDADYEVSLASEGKLGRFEVYVLELEARHNEVTFPYLRLWVTKDSFLILKTEDYSVTRRLLRTSYYPRYTRAGDAYMPAQIILIDELVEGKKTTMNFEDVSTAPLPDSVFTKAYVERVSQ